MKLLAEATLALHEPGMVDVVIVSAVILCGVLGFLAGFLWQAIRTGLVLVCFLATAHLHPVLAGLMGDDVSSGTRHTVAYWVLFTGLLLVCQIGTAVLRRLIGSPKPTLTGRVLGAILGLVKGWLICSALVVAVLRYGPESSGFARRVRESPTAKASAASLKAVWYVLPCDFLRLPED